MFDIREMPDPVDPALVEFARSAEPATIGHFRLRGFPDGAIRAIANIGPQRVAGTAVTLALPGCDSTLLHHAAGLLRPGDFLLVDRLGDRRHACVGGGVAVALSRAGIAGLLVDGPCADPGELHDSGLPVWARGLSSITTRLQGIGGAMNVPVSVGGAVVQPGDLVIANEGGAVVLPVAEARPDIEKALGLQREEQAVIGRIGRELSLGDAFGASALVKEKQGRPA